jgi:hypothetical protein
MAPGFDQLSDHDYQDEEDNIDFSDLKERYDVRMEEGLDTFVVCWISPKSQFCMLRITGYRWSPNRHRRTKTPTHQIPTQEIKYCWKDKRRRRVHLYAYERCRFI